MSTQSIQPGPIYRLTFGDLTLGTAAVTVPASASDTEIATAIHQHLLADGYGVVTVDVDRAAERAEVYDAQGRAFGTVTIAGPITPVDPDDYWLQLAGELHRAADRLATLAGTGKASSVHLTITGSPIASTADRYVPIVDAVTAALDLPAAKAVRTSTLWYYETNAKRGPLRLAAETGVPGPEDTRVAELERQLAEARAALAAGGVQ